MLVHRVARRILNEEPPKKAILFVLFTMSTPQELKQLDYLYPNELEEWKRYRQGPEDIKQNLKELGF